MKKNYLLLLFLLSFFHLSYASTPADSIPVEILITKKGSSTLFNADLPPLQGTIGGRQPFYTYLWDFGDGHFSLKESPEHNYADTGDYTVNLYVVNNYDDGPRPKRRAKKVLVQSGNAAPVTISNAEENFFSSNGVFQVSKNANAFPGQDMTLIVGVKNPGKGKVLLLTNEKMYGEEGLSYVGQSTYNREQIIPSASLTNLNELWASVQQATVTLSGSPDYGIKEELSFKPNEAIAYFSELYDSYKTISTYEVENNAENAQFSFINLDVTDEMLADTNAIVTITGIYVPEKGDAVVHKLEVPVVTSHDPNKMSIKQSRLNYRTLSKTKELLYKVQFQNDGEGDAKNVRLEIALPEQVDPSTFELLNLYPYCEPCLTEEERGCWKQYIKNDTLVFHFKDISLPGTQAEDITDQDSTKGFIRFTVKTKKKLENRSFSARTEIFFDKNDPIKTNRAKGRFKKSLSPILFGGYNSFISQPGFKDGKYTENGMLGVGLSPLAPYRKVYWQFEVYGSISKYSQAIRNIPADDFIVVDWPNDEGNLEPREVYYREYDREMEARILNLRVVPLHLRYNFTSYISAGIGALTEFNVNLNSKEERIYKLEKAIDQELLRLEHGPWDEHDNKFAVKTFIDLTVGKVYLGPSLGLRYHYGASSRQHMNLYAAWRF